MDKDFMKRDPVEETEEYRVAMEKIFPILDKEFPKDSPIMMGQCHILWARKKELLKKEGVDWKTPAEMNPYIIFD